MAVELTKLYNDFHDKYQIQVLTESCFDRMIAWINVAEHLDYNPQFHRDELIFNSGAFTASDDWIDNFVRRLNEGHAGGLVISVRRGKVFPQKVIDYCNKEKFPLFQAVWQTPYNELMMVFARHLIQNEQTEANMIIAVKNAIFYPANEAMYLSDFEHNGYFRDMSYTIIMIGYSGRGTVSRDEYLQKIKKYAAYTLKKGVVYEDEERLMVLTAGYSQEKICEDMEKFGRELPNMYVGIGRTVQTISKIHDSYESAYVAYQLVKSSAEDNNIISYEKLGVYKLLADYKDIAVYKEFADDTLGSLIRYDKENGTEYMHILEAFFKNECNILATSKALFCHKNTLNYKMNYIREILGFDIMSNENRTKIMMSFYIMRMLEYYYN